MKENRTQSNREIHYKSVCKQCNQHKNAYSLNKQMKCLFASFSNTLRFTTRDYFEWGFQWLLFIASSLSHSDDDQKNHHIILICLQSQCYKKSSIKVIIVIRKPIINQIMTENGFINTMKKSVDFIEEILPTIKKTPLDPDQRGKFV